MRRLLGLMAGLLMALVGVVSAPERAPAVVGPLVHAYSYDSAHAASNVPFAQPERGPPADSIERQLTVAGDRGQRAASTCPDSAAVGDDTTYDYTLTFVSSDSSRAVAVTPTSVGDVQTGGGTASPL